MIKINTLKSEELNLIKNQANDEFIKYLESTIKYKEKEEEEDCAIRAARADKEIKGIAHEVANILDNLKYNLTSIDQNAEENLVNENFHYIEQQIDWMGSIGQTLSLK